MCRWRSEAAEVLSSRTIQTLVELYQLWRAAQRNEDAFRPEILKLVREALPSDRADVIEAYLIMRTTELSVSLAPIA